jgi:hypothetical protein
VRESDSLERDTEPSYHVDRIGGCAPQRRRVQTESHMAGTDARNSDGAIGTRRPSSLKYTPSFLYILVLFIAGKYIFADPRATLVQWGEYHLSWVEVLMVGAAMMAMAEQLNGLTSWS